MDHTGSTDLCKSDPGSRRLSSTGDVVAIFASLEPLVRFIVARRGLAIAVAIAVRVAPWMSASQLRRFVTSDEIVASILDRATRRGTSQLLRGGFPLDVENACARARAQIRDVVGHVVRRAVRAFLAEHDHRGAGGGGDVPSSPEGHQILRDRLARIREHLPTLPASLRRAIEREVERAIGGFKRQTPMSPRERKALSRARQLLRELLDLRDDVVAA